MLRRLLGIAMLGTLVACEAALGVDFSAFHSDCSPGQSCPSGYGCFFTGGQFTCAPAGMASPYFGTCSTDTDCTDGYGCVHYKGTQNGHCLKYCMDASACFDQSKCYSLTPSRLLKDGTEQGVCLGSEPTCDPFATSSTCSADNRCTVVDDDFNLCIPISDVVAQDDPCTVLNNCPSGTSCIGGTSGYFCRKLCHYGMNDCPNGMTCNELAAKPHYMGDEIGFCK